jgi:hypothetical protein
MLIFPKIYILETQCKKEKKVGKIGAKDFTTAAKLHQF